MSDDGTRSYQAEAREELREGDIVCFQGRGPLGWLIRRATNSEYSHVGMIHRYEGRVYCLEAVGAGVRLVLMSHLVRRYKGGIDYFSVDAGDGERRTAVGWGFTQLGKLYDTAGLLSFAWTILTARIAVPKRDDQWFCSEFVAAAFEEAGCALVPLAANFTSPNDLASSDLLAYRYEIKP